MKLIFKTTKDFPIMSKLEEIAQKYQTTVHLDDDDISHFILIPPKLQLKQNEDEKHYTITVWGATNDDLAYFTTIFGEPIQTIKELPSPLEFAKELIQLPNVREKTLEEIMAIFELDERRLNQYKKIITIQAQRKKDDELFQLASELLNKQ
ncbi:hypothetical protein DRO91_02030 [Candidatus Heimdallarchaeota archaeon]|nr:MAG: hypothetical protein DRP02_08735 [Candidatus Gerdarchaeota archaeon]RLI73837.1 MAG: hypothetical protein DRO91_02030 [Candidatus Heimdallarchaeota archaeon]